MITALEDCACGLIKLIDQRDTIVLYTLKQGEEPHGLSYLYSTTQLTRSLELSVFEESASTRASAGESAVDTNSPRSRTSLQIKRTSETRYLSVREAQLRLRTRYNQQAFVSVVPFDVMEVIIGMVHFRRP